VTDYTIDALRLITNIFFFSFRRPKQQNLRQGWSVPMDTLKQYTSRSVILHSCLVWCVWGGGVISVKLYVKIATFCYTWGLKLIRVEILIKTSSTYKHKGYIHGIKSFMMIGNTSCMIYDHHDHLIFHVMLISTNIGNYPFKKPVRNSKLHNAIRLLS
jgi:hypothetical protein